jgi:hypothetical protein
MQQDVQSFKQCEVCQKAKHELCKYLGLLQPLPIPQSSWSDISMDLIEGLPLSHGYSVILVVVDRFTKYCHFFPIKHPYIAASIAQVFLDNVAKLCVPKSIVCDRNKVFTSTFRSELFKLLKTELKLSSAYHPHPQTDGQTKRVTQCLEMYLCCSIHVSPNNWTKWLSLAELWYNTSFHTSLQCSPFKTLYDTDPSLGLLPTLHNLLITHNSSLHC